MSKKTPTEPPVDGTPAQRGGRARATALTPEQRSEIARKGGRAKALAGLPRATHTGNFRKDFGIDVDCYVLDDERHTAIISKRGMARAIGMTEGGGRLNEFITGQRISPHGGRELAEKIANPLKFIWAPVGGNSPPPSLVHGYNVTILIDICEAIIAADVAGALQKRHANMVKQAHIIMGASSRAGITNLVYALAGYDQTREEVIAAFKLYVAEEARGYEKEFPDELYEEWYRLYDLPKPEKNRPWKFKALTIDHVYKPLAKSNGKILSLLQSRRGDSATRHKKLHEFLSQVGVKALRMHLGRLVGMAETSPDRVAYEAHVERVFSQQLRWEF